MRNLFFAGLVLATSVVVVGCGSNDASQPPKGFSATWSAGQQTATAPLRTPATAVKPSQPCYTPDDSQKPAIIAALNKVGGRIKMESFEIWVDGNCPRGTFDWSSTNSFVESHPEITDPSKIPTTLFQQLADWEKSENLPFGTVDRNVFWMSGIGPSNKVCQLLNLRCDD